ncbi:hypothetical protein NGB57_03435 [Escherichia coli]|nr:hypothetical protein [Escherichia coli]
MFDYTDFQNDPDNVGSVLCWACYSMDPWHLAGIYLTEEEAKEMLEVLGKGYEVSYGSHPKNTDDFIGGL